MTLSCRSKSGTSERKELRLSTGTTKGETRETVETLGVLNTNVLIRYVRRKIRPRSDSVKGIL